MERLKKYRIALIIVLIIDIVYICASFVYKVSEEIPDSLKVYVGDDSWFDFGAPVEADLEGAVEAITISNSSKTSDGEIHFSMKEPFVVSSDKTGKYKVDLKLFGVFTLKSISLDVIDSINLIPCGNAIGLQVKTDGLLVLGTGTVKGEDGLDYEPAYEILQTGDYITGINGVNVKSIINLQAVIQSCNEDSVTLVIRRNNKESKVKVPTVHGDDGITRIGVWVREDTQGIGTLTYISEDNRFAALGHGITDSDTGILLDIKSGRIYNTELIQIIKGSKGKPGELMGVILESESNRIGNIKSNTPLGISGRINSSYDTSIYKYGSIPVALRQDIKKGPATILTQLDDKIEEFEIKITEINRSSNDNKSFIIKITDEELIERTGGIIQGMSGSPIIQNGRIVGAVTHVLVNDPTRGYGIFIENMFEHN